MDHHTTYTYIFSCNPKLVQQYEEGITILSLLMSEQTKERGEDPPQMTQ